MLGSLLKRIGVCSPAESESFVRLVHHVLLYRQPGPAELHHYLGCLLAGRMNHAEIVAAIAELRDPASASCDPEIDALFAGEARRASAELQSFQVLDKAAYQRAWSEVFASDRPLVIGQQEYGRQHQRRFWELFNAVALLTAGNPAPRILEFGISEFSAIYKKLNPNIILHTSDRPTTDDYPGFTGEVCRRISGCELHVAIDLSRSREVADGFARYLNSYDLVVFAETLEHLVVNPIELLGQLLLLLAPGGAIYLTTPNCYRRENLEKIARRLNPLQPYPGDHANWDAHYHYREYCQKELLMLIDQAGGETAMFYYSDCWDDDRDASLPVDQRGNLVFVIRRKGSP